MPSDHSTHHTAESTSSATSVEENTKPPPLRVGLHAHWDCFSGAAGDMMLAACLDAVTFDDDNVSNTSISSSQVFLKKIEDAIKFGLPDLANEFSIDCHRVWKGSGSITAMHVTVHSIYQHKPVPVPPPMMSYQCATSEETSSSQHHDHGHEHHHSHTHTHAHNHQHDHDHQRLPLAGENNSSVHQHNNDSVSSIRIRNLPEIRQMLMSASKIYIPKWVRDHAIAAFTELAKAEAIVHGATSMDDVHFHEVGAIDSIVDTVGTLLALHYLNVTSVSCSRLPLGEGMVSTAHGILPVPAPATLRLMAGMPITSGPPGRTGELVTPTAASLLRVLVHQRPHDGRAPNMTLRKVGIGAGTKDFVNHPNIIRLLLGEKIDDPK
jgi:pyridinium-3,5-bisthiocarboxylic acid mononucleotide nickel chelatase